MLVPRSIDDLAKMFDRLPGVGPRAALRYAYWLAGQPKPLINQFADVATRLAEQIKTCEVCGMWTDESPCSVCADPARDASLLCVVAHSQDIRVMEDASVYRGKYHVLGGLIDPVEGKTAEHLSVARLVNRIKNNNPEIKEVVLALDPDVLGDTTALYLTRQLSALNVPVSRLARGIPTGAQIEYADEATISDAYLNRRKN
ncbi:MAG: recombination mediator RecR [Patescibacteria group bacterium]|nr:recombination mediator RecR [Patescibacteria group bacterium]